jgi:hypothetical protein
VYILNSNVRMEANVHIGLWEYGLYMLRMVETTWGAQVFMI